MGPKKLVRKAKVMTPKKLVRRENAAVIVTVMVAIMSNRLILIENGMPSMANQFQSGTQLKVPRYLSAKNSNMIITTVDSPISPKSMRTHASSHAVLDIVTSTVTISRHPECHLSVGNAKTANIAGPQK